MSQKALVIPPGRSLALVEKVERRILFLRGHKVLLDVDLAGLYGVPTKQLNQQVRRNLRRFPSDFMFQLTARDVASLRSQFVTSKTGRGGRRYAPLAFTEQGVAMLSSVLNSERAIEVNVFIMRAFVRLREILATHKDLAHTVETLAKTCDARFEYLLNALHKLQHPRTPRRRPIGFLAHVQK
ncbi:MAG: ORF6N domain-containing protein [Acidobacteria bacterium]|nr:ORF6N domain-containing protein [Acidobacteriota bacterium]